MTSSIELPQSHPLWTSATLIFSMITMILFVFLTFIAMIYWCQKYKRNSKVSSDPSELTPFSSLSRPNELKQQTGQFRAKNLLERRGTNNPLTLTVIPKIRLINSPPSDHSADEYLQIATRKLTIDELHRHALDVRALYQEFWSIPSNHLDKLRIPGAGTKNRYGTIIANEHSRVKLPVLSDDPASSYINANYIHGWSNRSRAFIATQGPLANTIVDFYRMIWQENVSIIVMITRLIEKNRTKCESYLPNVDEQQQYGTFRVRIQSIVHKNDYEIRRLIIEYENEQREVDHYWYTAWQDQSCPKNVQSLIELVQDVDKHRKQSAPIVVHCSAGIGRTGCFIALSNGIEQLNAEREIDVVRIVCNLRRDRGGMIQTHDQYQFLYLALSEYARTLA